MASHTLTEIFELNFTSWKILFMWPLRDYEKWFKYYCFIFMSLTMLLYHALLITNCIYTPLKIEIIMEEIIFYFTEIAFVVKAYAILFRSDLIHQLLNTLQSESFRHKDEEDLVIVNKTKLFYYRYRRTYYTLCYGSYICSVVYGLLVHLIWDTDLKLPVSNYSFLSSDTKAKYIYVLFTYQSVCLYIHMEVNINADTFLVGLIVLATAQVEILCKNLVNIRATKSHTREVEQLSECIKHYQTIARYCKDIQSLYSAAIMAQFSVAIFVICMSLLGFLWPSASFNYAFLCVYTLAITAQILLPCWMGTNLTSKSQQLKIAAFNCEWIGQPKNFSRNLIFFIERVNRPLQIVGAKMFRLSFESFMTVMKTAYSFFMLLRNLQAREDSNAREVTF